uniref:BPTI/Kunitz inhibitor domain-containing protein n=1 Tax=Ditylenchus dipsaci TaxID=166011 RepID=A0A915ECN5_9BILA
MLRQCARAINPVVVRRYWINRSPIDFPGSIFNELQRMSRDMERLAGFRPFLQHDHPPPLSFSDYRIQLWRQMGRKNSAWNLIIEAKHSDENSKFEYYRKVSIPEGVKLNEITCNYKSNGALELEAPYIEPEKIEAKDTPIVLCSVLVYYGSDVVEAALPDELDPFLEILFQTEECESFLSDGAYLSVGTSQCKPFTCDFPLQLCMRASALYKEESANECKEIPTACIKAANGGFLPSRRGKPSPSIGTANKAGGTGVDLGGSSQGSGVDQIEGATQSPSLPTEVAISNGRNAFRPRGAISVCDLGVPEGRFCGFALKFAYNRETGGCDQFWFPGCPTENTNDNLFNSLAECREASSHCDARSRPVSIFTPPPPPSTRRPDQVVPNPNARSLLPGGGFVPVGNVGGSSGAGSVPSSGNFNLGSAAGGLSQLLGGALGGGGGDLSGLGGLPAQGGGSGSSIGGSEYGGGALGNSGVTQPPNFIRLIANTIKEVGESRKNGGAPKPGGDWLANASQFTNIFQTLQLEEFQMKRTLIVGFRARKANGKFSRRRQRIDATKFGFNSSEFAKKIQDTRRNERDSLPPSIKQIENFKCRQNKSEAIVFLEQLKAYAIRNAAVPERLQQQSKMIQVDATYKLNWHGFPVLVCGFSDSSQHFCGHSWHFPQMKTRGATSAFLRQFHRFRKTSIRMNPNQNSNKKESDFASSEAIKKMMDPALRNSLASGFGARSSLATNPSGQHNSLASRPSAAAGSGRGSLYNVGHEVAKRIPALVKPSGNFGSRGTEIVDRSGYPYGQIKSHHMQPLGASHSWPAVLGALAWLIDVIELDNNHDRESVKDELAYSYVFSCFKKKMLMEKLPKSQQEPRRNDNENAIEQVKKDIEEDKEKIQTVLVSISRVEENIIADEAGISKLLENLVQIEDRNEKKETLIQSQTMTGDEARSLILKRRTLKEQLSSARAALHKAEMKFYELHPKFFKESGTISADIRRLSCLQEFCRSLNSMGDLDEIDWSLYSYDLQSIVSLMTHVKNSLN